MNWETEFVSESNEEEEIVWLLAVSPDDFL